MQWNHDQFHKRLLPLHYIEMVGGRGPIMTARKATLCLLIKSHQLKTILIKAQDKSNHTVIKGITMVMMD